jgi:phage protein U
MVVDHFGWPTQLDDNGRRNHLDRLARLAAKRNVATRIDAIGTIYGTWTIVSASLHRPDRVVGGELDAGGGGRAG